MSLPWRLVVVHDARATPGPVDDLVRVALDELGVGAAERPGPAPLPHLRLERPRPALAGRARRRPAGPPQRRQVPRQERGRPHRGRARRCRRRAVGLRAAPGRRPGHRQWPGRRDSSLGARRGVAQGRRSRVRAPRCPDGRRSGVAERPRSRGGLRGRRGGADRSRRRIPSSWSSRQRWQRRLAEPGVEDVAQVLAGHLGGQVDEQLRGHRASAGGGRPRCAGS